MMDLKPFGENDFDPKVWINQTWEANKNQTEEEVFANNLVNKLELYMKQLNHTIEETSNQVVTWVPRIIDEAKLVKSEGETVRSQLAEVEGQILAVEEQTGHSVLGLQRIHTLKSRLESASSALREADKWAQLLTQLEDILDDAVPSRAEKLKQIIDLVADMTNSLEVLIDAPDFSKKRNQLQTMCDRLEATYSPHLVDALTQKNSDTTRPYVRLFASMRRHSSLLRYWRRIEVTRLQSDEKTRSSDALHSLLTHAQTQLEWLRDVLECPTPVTELTRLYTEVLVSCDPSPLKLLRASLDRSLTPSDAINMLCDLNTRYADFLKQYSDFVQYSKGKEKVPEDVLWDFSKTVCSPLRELLPRYTELQARVLTDHLQEIYKEQKDYTEMCRLARFSVERSATWLETAKANSKKIAGDSFFMYLTPAIEAFISAHCSRLASNLRLLTVNEDCLPAALSLTIASGNLALLLKEFSDKLQSDIKEIASSSELKTPWSVQTPEVTATQVMSHDSTLSAAADDIRRMCRTLKGYVLKIIFEPVATELEKVPNLKIWSENDTLATDLPDFSLSPQEYITQVGQYLLTLPQHIEPYLTDGQTGLAYAVGAQPDHLSWYFVNEVCNQTSELYVDKILSIKNMDTLGAKRCVTDIAYLSSVVEDLGGSVSTGLKNLEGSLRTTQKRMQ